VNLEKIKVRTPAKSSQTESGRGAKVAVNMRPAFVRGCGGRCVAEIRDADKEN